MLNDTTMVDSSYRWRVSVGERGANITSERNNRSGPDHSPLGPHPVYLTLESFVRPCVSTDTSVSLSLRTPGRPCDAFEFGRIRYCKSGRAYGVASQPAR